MGLGFLNLLMLLGLGAVVIPPLIHLLSRRRYQVVDWGAMQFLQISETTRRRLLLEEIILMLLRIAAIAVMVLGMALPFFQPPGWAQTFVPRTNRDVVLIFDGSASMGETGTGKPAQEAAKEWAAAFVDTLQAGDSVSVLQAKQQVVPVLGELTSDLHQVRAKIAHLPEPRGGCDWPQAIRAAHKVLAKSQRPEREIVVLSDNQRFGWADDNSLLRWELLATELQSESSIRPRIWVANVAPERPPDPPNWTLAPLRASRAIASAGQLVTFRTALELRGQKEYHPPHRLRLEVDGSPVSDLPTPRSAELGDRGQVPLSFPHRFTTPGSHLVSVIVEPDPPVEQRPPDYRIKDRLPGDNRQDFAVEVLPALPVLLVDGDDRLAPRHRGTDFLRDALAPARDRNPVVMARVVPIRDFDPALLGADLGKEAGTRPRVLVLSNVARLTAPQQDAVAQFLSSGGGVLVTLGDRVEAPSYNDELFRGGQGWLPARLDDQAGDESDLAHAPAPLRSSFFHPAVELFREVHTGGLGDARFPRWWRVSVPGKVSPAVPVALLTNNDPLLVERPYPGVPSSTTPGAGRVLLASVPLDNSWRTNLPDLPAFAPLAHELIYYLAGARSAEYNLQPGQPLHYRPDRDDTLTGLLLQPPEGEAKPLMQEPNADADVYPCRLLRQAQGPLLVYEGTRDTGVYQLKTPDHRTVYYVVQPDPRESDLTPCSEQDRDRVAKLVPTIQYENDRQQMARALVASSQRQEVWWGFLFAVVALLCGEVWMTRRVARNR
jgi:hypothetical protein